MFWLKVSAAAPLMTLIRKTERLIKTDFRMVLDHRHKLVVKLKASGVIQQESCASKTFCSSVSLESYKDVGVLRDHLRDEHESPDNVFWCTA